MLRKILFLLLISFVYLLSASGFDLEVAGTPFIKNFDRSSYNAGNQNWCIVQDDDHVLWFGNSGVVLWYDGEVWGSVEIPRGAVARSMATLPGNRILVGSFSEFGVIVKNRYGKYEYESWIEKVPQRYRDFSDVWEIYEFNNRIYIQTVERIIVFKGDDFEGTIAPENAFRFSFISNGGYYVEDVGIGLKILVNERLNLIENGSFFMNHEIWMVTHLNGKLLVGTQKDGLFVYENSKWIEWNVPVNRYLKKNLLYSTTITNHGELVFGTINNGLLFSDRDGNIRKIINVESGLQNNTILSMAVDFEDNLWLGLDRGIDYLKINSPFSLLTKKGVLGVGYASVYFQGKLYLGTNTGVYLVRQMEGQINYTLVQNTGGQVWNFFSDGSNLYCLHHNGIFLIRETVATQISKINGCWKMVPVSGFPDEYILGTYTGLYHVKLNGGMLIANKYDGFQESSRILEFDDTGNLWMSHGYRGVFKIQFDEAYSRIMNVSFYNESKGLPSDLFNELVRIDNTLLFTTVNGFYNYNDVTGMIDFNKTYSELLKTDQVITKLIQDRWGRIHLFADGELSMVILNNDSVTFFEKELFRPVFNTFIPAFENASFINEAISIIGFEDGFYLYNRDKVLPRTGSVPLFIRKFTTFTHQANIRTQLTEVALFGSGITIPYSQNSIVLELSIPLFEKRENVLLSYEFNGKTFSLPEGESVIELTSLREGKYEIIITAKDITGIYSEGKAVIHFEILAPWTRQWYAYFGYLLILLAIIVLVVYLIRKNIKRIRRREQIYQQRKMFHANLELKKKAEIAEQNLIKLRNEQLLNENRLKTQQIANSTMELVQKNKMLLDVRHKLSELKKETDIEVRNSILRDILKKINRDLDNEENWTIFEKNFDEIHENFLKRLSGEHKGLTAKDLRLCAYLRMNLSSKEIAPLLRISVRSVEISRYRMRKKMNLPHDVSLSDYILHF
jgi:DNA-binding CsgD family transcriptional regulator